jgi:hypothetical protein
MRTITGFGSPRSAEDLKLLLSLLSLYGYTLAMLGFPLCSQE